MVYNDRAAAKGTLAHPTSDYVHLSRDCCPFPGVKRGEPYWVILSSYVAVSNRCFLHFVPWSHFFCCCSSSSLLGFPLNSFPQKGVVFQLGTWRKPLSHKIAQSNLITYKKKDLFLENWCKNSLLLLQFSVSNTLPFTWETQKPNEKKCSHLGMYMCSWPVIWQTLFSCTVRISSLVPELCK